MNRLSVKQGLRKLRLARLINRKITGGITFVKYEDLVGFARTFADEVGNHDCVVGIPRTGLVVAAVIANRLGVPFFTPENLPKHRFTKILLVDDGCTRQHGTMEQVAETVNPKTKAAIFTTEEGKECLDKYMFLVQDKPILYEWDLFHVNPPSIPDSLKAFDLDGVLCKDPPNHVTTDSYAFNAEPYLIPNFKIGYIITGRPDSLRLRTEQWLKKQNIEYGELLFTQNKAKVLLEKVPSIYYESDYATALILAKRTHIPIVAVDRMELLYE